MLPSRPNAESCQLLVNGEYIEQDMTELASSVVVNLMSLLFSCCLLCVLRSLNLVRKLNCLWRPSGFTRHSINFKCSVDAKTSLAPSMHYQYTPLDLSESSLLAIPSTNAAYSITTQITTVFTEF